MKKITFKTIKGKHIVSVDENDYVFETTHDVWNFIFAVRNILKGE